MSEIIATGPTGLKIKITLNKFLVQSISAVLMKIVLKEGRVVTFYRTDLFKLSSYPIIFHNLDV